MNQTRIELENEAHHYHPNENPVFLPGDKVYDKRDHKKTVFRIKSRVAHYDDEYMELEQVKTRLKQTVLASTLIPYLVMVAKFKV